MAMSEFLRNLVNLIKSAIFKVKSIDELRRLIKYGIGVLMIMIWYFRLKPRPHDNIVMLPDWHPIFGHSLEIHHNFDRGNQWIYEQFKNAGWPKCAAMSAFIPFYGIALMDPEIVKFVFDTKFEKFRKGERIQTELEEMLGDGIFTSDPPDWKFHRKSM